MAEANGCWWKNHMESYMAQVDPVAQNIRDYGQPTSFWWAQRGGPDGNSGNPKKKRVQSQSFIVFYFIFIWKVKLEKNLEQKALGPWLIIGFAMVSSKSWGTMRFHRPWPKPLLSVNRLLSFNVLIKCKEYISHCPLCMQTSGHKLLPITRCGSTFNMLIFRNFCSQQLYLSIHARFRAWVIHLNKINW